MLQLSETSTRGFGGRLLGAGRLDAATFREIAPDRAALVQAAWVVGVAGAARGAAAFASEGWLGLAGSVIAGFVFWGVVALVVRGASRWFLARRPPLASLARALGFAAAPLWLLFGAPWLPAPAGLVLFWLAHAWAAVAASVAVREACDTTPRLALLICVTALLAGIAVLFAVGLLLVGRLARA